LTGDGVGIVNRFKDTNLPEPDWRLH
jgi:hypothetical protein